jgi:hypothetical protein
VIDIAHRRNDHARRAVVPREIIAQGFGREGAHRLRGAENRAADRLIGKGALLKQVEDDVVGRIVGGADLLQHHALFADKFGRIELRPGENIAQDVERERHVLAKHAGVIAGVLKAGRCVQIAADGFDFLDDLARIAPRRALERHVLEEVRDAVFVRVLVSRPRTDPDAERSRAQMVHAVGDDREATGELLYAGGHTATPATARLWSDTKRATAPASAGSRAIRSGRSSRSARRGGNSGRTPIAACTASGNFAGWAVASVTTGDVPSCFSLRATATPTALCGSST